MMPLRNPEPPTWAREALAILCVVIALAVVLILAVLT
jgi:hypothetical protein